MFNAFKRAAMAIGRFTGIYRGERSAMVTVDDNVFPNEALIAEVGAAREGDAIQAGDGGMVASDANAMMNGEERPAGDGSLQKAIEEALAEGSLEGQLDGREELPAAPDGPTPWGESALHAEGISATVMSDPEAAIAMSQGMGQSGLLDLAFDQPLDLEPVAALIPLNDVPTAPEASGEMSHAETPIEIKPEALPAAGPAQPTISFSELYDLITTEVNMRTDTAIGVYERLLATTREELTMTRRGNRLAWSIGGVMTAIAVMGSIWAASEVSGTRVELSTLKSQVTMGTQAAAERDQLRGELNRVKDETARYEVGALRMKLEKALVTSADRERISSELEATRKAKESVENELRLARLTSTTQPVSMARPANAVETTLLGDRPSAADGAVQAGSKSVAANTTASKSVGADKSAVGSERTDRWSVLLNGKE